MATDSAVCWTDVDWRLAPSRDLGDRLGDLVRHLVVLVGRIRQLLAAVVEMGGGLH